MRLRTRTTRRAASAGLALVTAAALTACSSDGGGSEDTSSEDTSSSETAEASDAPAPQTPVEELILQKDEAPAEGVVQPIDPPLLQEGVDKLVADQGRRLMENDACDKVSRLETVSNHATEGGSTSMVRYKESADNPTEHTFGISMVGMTLDDFMDRSLYEACTTSASLANPNVELVMTVADAPAVEGARGFRVTSDFIATQPDGTKTLSRSISIHGLSRDTTVTVEYGARGTDPNADPVLPAAANVLDAIYAAQMEKIVNAE